MKPAAQEAYDRLEERQWPQRLRAVAEEVYKITEEFRWDAMELIGTGSKLHLGSGVLQTLEAASAQLRALASLTQGGIAAFHRED